MPAKPSAEIHLLDAGHFILDEAADQVAFRMRRFLDAHRPAGTPHTHNRRNP